MIEIGKKQSLKIINFTSHGAFLDGKTGKMIDNILLPSKEIPDGAKEGDVVEVFIYRDSQDRLIATTREPIGKVGELVYLKVLEITDIGAFLDWGLEKDLFLPFAEQKFKVQVGRSYLVAIYVDKSGRLSATTDIDKYLENTSPYEKVDRVKGTVYRVDSEMGAFVAVDNKYKGLIHKSEYFHEIRNGDQIEARIVKIREDGKLDLSTRSEAYKQMHTDAEQILQRLQGGNGFLPLNDKSKPETIKNKLNMSKASFKRAIGALLKEDKIEQTDNGIKLKEEI
ncbi:MAG: S1 RNA-binding domain-containing protein [Alkaliphilus sp.]|nr:S1 RNA-binding domain-containing protein [Alkaliphilus sp.]